MRRIITAITAAAISGLAMFSTAVPASAHAPAAQHHAVQGPWTYAKLYAALRDPGYGPFLICSLNAPLGKDRMGLFFYAMSEKILGRACDASREWHIIDLGNDINGVPEINIQAVADGESLAVTPHCAWVVRHADVNTEGTLWKFAIFDGDLFIASNKCSGVDKHGLPRYNKDIATNNRPDNRWFIADRNHPDPGDYIRMWFKIPPS